MFSINDELNAVRLLHIATPQYACSHASMPATDILKHGVVFVDKNGEVLEKVNKDFALAVINAVGISNEIWSRTFHKSWNAVENKPIEELVLEQMIHYLSTYGMEAIGLTAMPVIPCEEVISNKDALPNVRAFTVVRIVDFDDAIKTVENFIKGIKASNKNHVNAIVSLMDYTNLAVDDIQSFELKAARCRQLNTVPKDGQDFLRFVTYSLTGGTLLIKNTRTIETIKHQCRYKQDEVYELFRKCNEVELAKIFHRFKPIILAFKECDECRPIVNRIRRLADMHHKPLSKLNVANIMQLLSENDSESVSTILKNADNRTLVKLINFAMSSDSDVKIYNIRNGSTYVTEKKSNDKNIKMLLSMCYMQLITKNKTKLCGKTFLIPTYVDYAVPVSEKQMIGNIPYGTIINSGTKNFITPAIWWTNHNGRRTDIDFHLSNATIHFGWNGSYRSTSRNVLYSGDMVNASDYASEAYRIDVKDDDAYMLSANLYSGDNNCPFKFMITDVDISEKKDAPVNVENALFSPIEMRFIDTRQVNLGFVKGNKFCFYGNELGQRLVPDIALNAKALDATVNRCMTMFKMNEFIKLCGGRIITDMSDVDEDTTVIDLSPNAIASSTLFEIID